MKKLLKTILIVTAVTLLLSAVAHGAGINPDFKPFNEPFDVTDDIANAPGDIGAAEFATILILQIIAGALLYFAAPIAIIALVFAGLTMTRGGADPETLDSSKKHIQWTVIGLLVIILSYSLVRILLTQLIEAAG